MSKVIKMVISHESFDISLSKEELQTLGHLMPRLESLSFFSSDFTHLGVSNIAFNAISPI